MKKLNLIAGILPLLLASCSIPIPKNDFIEGKAGFFRETTALDPDGKPGVFFSRPNVEIIDDKP